MSTMKVVAFRGIENLVMKTDLNRSRKRAGRHSPHDDDDLRHGRAHRARRIRRSSSGLVLGHEPVGVIDALGDGLEPEYHMGQRVIVGAITPCGQCFYCLNNAHAQCGGPVGGWKFGNTIDGAWAEYLLVPDARANLAPIPDGLRDEEVVLVPDIFSTGLSGAGAGM